MVREGDDGGGRLPPARGRVMDMHARRLPRAVSLPESRLPPRSPATSHSRPGGLECALRYADAAAAAECRCRHRSVPRATAGPETAAARTDARCRSDSTALQVW